MQMGVLAKDRMAGETGEEHFMHCDRFLERCQIFTDGKKKKREECEKRMDKRVSFNYASSSCFILVNSSLVMVPSPSPKRWSFSREASKFGRGGGGGI